MSHGREAWQPLNSYIESKFCFLSLAIAEGLVLREDALKMLNTFLYRFFYREMNVIACIVKRLQELLKIPLYGTDFIPLDGCKILTSQKIF